MVATSIAQRVNRVKTATQGGGCGARIFGNPSRLLSSSSSISSSNLLLVRRPRRSCDHARGPLAIYGRSRTHFNGFLL